MPMCVRPSDLRPLRSDARRRSCLLLPMRFFGYISARTVHPGTPTDTHRSISRFGCGASWGRALIGPSARRQRGSRSKQPRAVGQPRKKTNRLALAERKRSGYVRKCGQ